MSDLVERLRAGEDGYELAAADEIERLTAELAAALAKLAQYEQAPVVGYVSPDSLPRLNVHNGERGVTLLSSWPRDPGSIALIARPEESK